MISSTVIVACRGKRWFDLDAVRSPLADSPGNRYVRKVSSGDVDGRQNATTGIDRETNKITADYDPAKSAGAPPLDWHVDGHTATPNHQLNEEPMTLRYVVGDTRDVTATIPDGSVDLIFTSPPFLALRSYLPAGHKDKHREIGSEANPAAFLDTLLELTAEWGRVLAPHGTLAVELGDTYSGSAPGGANTKPRGPEDVRIWANGEPPEAYFDRLRMRSASGTGPVRQRTEGWPLAKSLALIPQLYAVALAYGINPLTGQPSPAGRWRVRNWIAWHRPNPPVGALGDKWRPASSYITTACRGGKRWFDLDAVREPTKHPEHNAKYAKPGGGYQSTKSGGAGNSDRGDKGAGLFPNHEGGAPPLDWHTDGDLGTGHIILTTQPYAGSHYATFPMELPRKIIDCMCPRQVCRVCGVPRERVTGEPTYVPDKTHSTAALRSRREHMPEGEQQVHHFYNVGGNQSVVRTVETLGWSDCGHDNWRPGHVLDPFAGTGTTLAAAQDLGRDATGIDIDEDNAWLARERCGMFMTVEHFTPAVIDTADL